MKNPFPGACHINFFTANPFHPNLLIASKVGAYLTRLPSKGSLANKQWTRVKVGANDRHFIYVFLYKKFYRTVSNDQCYKNTVLIYQGEHFF
jgi:hypothetical protein